MAEKRPAFQWYPKDYLTDERVVPMTLEEEGAYRRLMDYCWLHGSLPNDMARLAAMCKASADHMAELWPAIEPCFQLVENRWIHPRLEIERRKQDNYRKAKSKAGKRGAKARWEKEENGTAIVLPMANDSSAVCSLQSATAVEDTKPSCLPPDTGGQEFSTYFKMDHECVLTIWHLGSETITIDGKEITMALEMHIRRQLCLARGEETVSGALPFIRQAEPDIGADVPISLRLAESRPEVMARCIGLWHKSTLGGETAA